MKVYATIVTVVLLVALGIGGYTILNMNGEIQGLEDRLEAERHRTGEAKRQVTELEEGIEAVKVTGIALEAVVDAPIIPGDVRIDRIEDATATDARQKLGDITDPKDKERALKEWDSLRNGGTVVSYQATLRVLSENLSRNLAPKQ